MNESSKTHIPAATKTMPAMEFNYTDVKEELDEPVEDPEPERGNWTGRFDFLLSLLGYSVGLGNVWRFPYLCYNNGGGAFLIPFTVMLIIAGLPLMFMELSFGQYAALGPVAVYNKFCPLFRGLGYGMVIVSCIVMLYYNLIIAWTIYYMAVSFVSIFYQLPWQHCDPAWSTQYCYSYEEADQCESTNGTYYLRECYNQSYAALHNIAELAAVATRKPPAEEYFTNQVLGLSSGIEETGHIRWGMALCLFAAWLIVFLCLCKGVQSSGKVVYFTALFPYVVLVILFFRGVTLPGASTGILFYLTPDFSQLANAQVWGDAAVQIFFALSPAWGGLITLSSYNKFSNNCYIDSLIVAVSNIATSFFAGLVIFSVIGFLAHELDVEVDKVVDQGAGLAFIVYPEVVTRLPISPLWSILFFVMLLTLGLDSQFALMETVTTAILDRFPNFRHNKVWVVMTVAIFGYLGGLIFTTNSGMYWLQLMDKYAANWSVLIIAICECILIAWIYGAEKFCRDIQSMIGHQSKLWVIFWSAMWRVITPSALVFILVFNWIEYKPASYGHYVYPMWADAVGWTLGVLPVVVVILMAVDQICSGPDDLTIMEASQDGGDSTSITSGFENELKKTGKSKKNSIKKKIQNFSNEADDAVIEPLLQKEKDESQVVNQSAKFLSKSKTDSTNDGNDTDKLLADKKMDKPSMTNIPSITGNIHMGNGIKDSKITTSIQNHMNSNIFAGHDDLKNINITKSPLVVKYDGNKDSSHSPIPCIFTTAKIHSDGQNKPIQPGQLTPVPISSTIEGTMVKSINLPEIDNNLKQVNPLKEYVSLNMELTDKPSCSFTVNKQKEENNKIKYQTPSPDTTSGELSLSSTVLHPERIIVINKNITPTTTTSENIKDVENTVNIKKNTYSTSKGNLCKLESLNQKDTKSRDTVFSEKNAMQSSSNNKLKRITTVSTTSDYENINKPKIIALDSKINNTLVANTCPSSTLTNNKISVVNSLPAKSSQYTTTNLCKIKTPSIDSKSTTVASKFSIKQASEIAKSDSASKPVTPKSVMNSTIKSEKSSKSKTEMEAGFKPLQSNSLSLSTTTSKTSTVSTMKSTVTSAKQPTGTSTKSTTTTSISRASSGKMSTVTTMKPVSTKTVTMGTAKSNSTKPGTSTSCSEKSVADKK